MTSTTGDQKQGGESSSGALLQLAKHSGVYAIGTLLSKAASFLMLPLYTAYLTPFQYGVLDIVDTTASMIGMVIGFGMASALGRFYFDFEDAAGRNRAVSTAFLLAAASACLMVAISVPLSAPLVSVLFGESVAPSTLLWAIYTIALGLVVDLGNVYLRLVNRSVLFVGISIANMVIGVGLNIFFVVWMKLGVMGILYSNLITKVIVGLPQIYWILKQVGLRFDRKIASNMYRYGLPLMPSEIASVAIGYSDRYFINGLLSTADAGIYGMAQKMGTVLHYLVSSPFLTAFMTQRFRIGKMPGAEKVLALAFKYHMVILIVLTGILSIFSADIIKIMTSAEYERASTLIPVAALGMIVLASKYHFEYGILRAKLTRYHMYINTSSAAMHMVLNYFLITYIGLWGALVAEMVAYGIKSAGYLSVSQWLYRIPFPVFSVGALLILTYAVVYTSILFSPGGLWGLGLRLAVAAGLMLLPFLLGVLSASEVRRGILLAREKILPKVAPAAGA